LFGELGGGDGLAEAHGGNIYLAVEKW
jgi:hypothetical protein